MEKKREKLPAGRAGKAILTVVFLLLMPQIANAMKVNKITLSDYLNADLSLKEEIRAEITNNSLRFISFAPPQGATRLSINGMPAKIWNGTAKIPLNCTECTVTISYVVEDAIKKESSETYTFSRTLNFPQNPLSLEYRVALPPGYILGDQKNNPEPLIVPAASEIKTDGTSIIVVWKENNPRLPQRYYLRYHSHEKTETAFESTSELLEWPSFTITAAAFLGGLIAGFALSRRRIIKTKDEGAEPEFIPASLLSPDEREIIRVIRESDKTLTQKEIGKILNWSKSKVSAIMTNLEHKEIVKREKTGRNYRVELSKEIKL